MLSTPNVSNYHHNCKIHSLPNKIDDNFAWLLGLLYGDGSVGETHIQIACTSDELDIMNKAIKVTKQLFNCHISVSQQKNSKSIIVSIASRHIVDFLKINNIAKEKSADIKVPQIILNCDRDIQMAFISGYLDADGSIKTQSRKDNKYSLSTVCFTSISFEFLDQIHNMLPDSMSTRWSSVRSGGLRYNKSNNKYINCKDSKELHIRPESWNDYSILFTQSIKINDISAKINTGEIVVPTQCYKGLVRLTRENGTHIIGSLKHIGKELKVKNIYEVWKLYHGNAKTRYGFVKMELLG